MIPIDNSVHTNINSSQFKSYAFGVDAEDVPHLAEILRNSIYTDKILAVIREYSTNAHDANVENNVKNRPIHVKLPTKLNPIFSVRDFGKGLSPDDVKSIFTRYGKSTKRGSNDFVGQLGIGSKAGFAYGDSFVVVSRNNGVKTTYNCIIKGDALILNTEPISAEDEPGVEILIPVKNDDIAGFRDKAANYYRTWSLLPTFESVDTKFSESIEQFKKLINESVLKTDKWAILPTSSYSHSDTRSFAVMGNVNYVIEWDTLKKKITGNANIAATDAINILNFIEGNSVFIRFDIGEIEFSASREGIQYSDTTCEKLTERLYEIANTIQSIVQLAIDKADDLWNAKIIYGKIFDFSYKNHNYKNTNFIHDKIKVSHKGVPITSADFSNIIHTIKQLYSNNGTNVPLTEQLPRAKMIVYDKTYDRLETTMLNTVKRGHIKCEPTHNILICNDYNMIGVNTVARYILKNKNDFNVDKLTCVVLNTPALEKAFFDVYRWDLVNKSRIYFGNYIQSYPKG